MLYEWPWIAEVANIQFEEGAENVHSVLHVIVENQLAMNAEPVPATIARLTRQGLSRHEAIHATGAVFDWRVCKVG